MNPFIFLRYLFLPVLVYTGAQLGGYYNYLVPLICFVLHPILAFYSSKKTGVVVKEIKAENEIFHLVALVFVPVLLATTFYMLNATKNTSSWASLTGMILSAGTMNGILGFTLAHEFIHRKQKLQQAGGFLLLVQNNYLHYKIEHIKGHHVYACTEKDPHTARENESFYAFLPRAIAMTWLNAWTIESKSLKKRNRSLFRHRLIQYALIHLLLLILVCFFFGLAGLVFFTGQSLVAISLLHITNYLQHYGLNRQFTVSGKERISEHHSWRTRMANDGLNLFQLENHADHHIHPDRPYFELERHEASPEMPTGYSGMILLALFPPAWFRVMNHRIPRNLA
jgi:alkane 1-monooxygenase